MAKGNEFPAEWRTFNDRETGAMVRQLTDYKGHSHHFYFTNSGWYEGGRKLLFGSDRENCTNLFSLNIEDGAILQVTDLPPGTEVGFLSASINPLRPECYYWAGRTLWAVDLKTLKERPLYERSEGFRGSITSVTADGRYVCTGTWQEVVPTELNQGYVGFRETWKARPLSRVLKVPVEGGEAEVVHEERYWIGHVNTSPTRPELLTFCHEGPWDLVDQRIWGLNLETREVWPIRPTRPGERVGHEFWLSDGERVGYHGTTPEGPIFGVIRWDGTGVVEFTIPPGSTHLHCRDLDLIVGDGSSRDPYLLLWRFREGRLEGPRRLVWHRSSFHIQQTHVHPRFTEDAKGVVYTSDHRGYGNVYLVEVPDFEELSEHIYL
ncbi:MAG TPA: oligogalacturonide lyase [Candidatus Latescibacteria bacterium]|nr:oligogalacturonide lyase [Candidatus Latescibacterota bacterium]